VQRCTLVKFGPLQSNRKLALPAGLATQGISR
jgi:hypothetical protein